MWLDRTVKVQTYDFVSRYFWPENGGVEDPVTGSIHGLAPAERLVKMVCRFTSRSLRSTLLPC